MGVTELVGTILLSSTGGIVLKTGIQNLLNRRKLGADVEKTDADTASVLSKTALELLQPLRDQVKDLKDQLVEANAQLDRVKVKADHLEQQLDECHAHRRRDEQTIHELRSAARSSPSRRELP